MMGRNVRRLAGHRRATTSIEFAIICAVLVPLSFAIIEGGLLLWTQGAMQSTAALVARCVAIGSSVASSPCNTTNNAKSYAVTTANTFVPIPGLFTTSNVSITTVTKCPAGTGANGNFQMVTITSNFWSGLSLPTPWGNQNLSVTACYPV
jgi:Flp pilus assembly protein TadG